MMKEGVFKKVCTSVQNGETRFVENSQNGHAGKIVSCSGEQLEVDIFGRHETWARKDCEEFEKPDFNDHR